MDFLQYKEAAFKAALEKGCSAAEVYFSDGEEFSVNVLDGELERYTVEHSYGLSLRVQLDGKNGYAYTEVLDDPITLVERAMDNARSIESTDVHPMQGKCEYREIPVRENPAKDMTAEDKIAYAMKLEKTAFAADSRVRRTATSTFATSSATVRIHNTLGLAADRSVDTCYAVIEPILEQEGVEKDSFSFRMNKKALDAELLVKESIEKAARQFGASPVPSGEYKVIIINEAASNMLSAFSPMFSADAAQKGLSLLNGKEGESIANDCITIMDDPFHEHSPRAFDAEGVPSVTKTVVENGVLKTLLHNLKTALKAGGESTSNASRAGGAIGVSPTNFYIVPGNRNYDELVTELDNGLVITEVGGLHSGLNTVSGDFSLIAKGLLIENGKVVRSVEQVTVAGNFLALMKGITEVGSDLELVSNIASPSLVVDKLVISGS